MAPADKASKSRIDLNTGSERVQLSGVSAQQINLAAHALIRTDSTSFPLVLDILPERIGKAFQQQIAGIERAYGPVEIDEEMALHRRS